MVLAQPSSGALHSVQGGIGDASCADWRGQVVRYVNGAFTPPLLTEEVVQSSVDTFEDAAWVRDEAVRSYAEFHNNVESLHATMRTQLRPVWRTAMQLHPDILADVRDEWHLRRRDSIPDNIPISVAASQGIELQETILHDVEDALQVLRNTSVRFAAHFLSDKEKISMGANPAYLRAPDIDREVVMSRSQSISTSPQRTLPAMTASILSSPGGAGSGHVRHSTSSASVALHTPSRQHSGRRHSRHGHHHHRHYSDVAGLVSSNSNRRTDSCKSSRRSRGTGDDPLLEELRKQYQVRISELKARSEDEGERRRGRHSASTSARAAPPRHTSLAHAAVPRSSSLSLTASSTSSSALTGTSSTRSRC
ncbi:conserved hypothetical protein [Leishmania braziliensis MHOM/BR/75/M2904]|uniref:Uncharacterized protein n=1 Tax=Leishmania braziliensis TaxID=5660 RepID=A4H328_LEIBR|nr:conserved hypothetical protein [Leishmania braziliensis MHOM/BR/75/M2904]CAJ2465588.1 unnamed protein product [Leishmania braziliensis]CAM36444.1 conserved hypothetical protein [Leishmania braziliensis MHOM/BR/75/M2904]